MKKDCQSSSTEAEGASQGAGLKQQKHLILRDRAKVWLLELLCEGYQRTKLSAGGTGTEFQIFSHSNTV